MINSHTEKYAPLGLVNLPEDTLEKDFYITDKYQAFTAEVLRLSLLAIGTIGFLIINLFKNSGESDPYSYLLKNGSIKYTLVYSLIFFGVSSSFALLHRYYSSDSIACQLRYYRIVTRGLEKDYIISFGKWRSEVEEEKDHMKLSLRLATIFIFWSVISLGLGTISLALSFVFWLFPDKELPIKTASIFVNLSFT